MKKIVWLFLFCGFFTLSCNRVIDQDNLTISDRDFLSTRAICKDSLSNCIPDSSWVELSNGLILRKVGDKYFWDDMVFTEDGLGYLDPYHNRAAIRSGSMYYWPYGIVYYSFNSNVGADTSYVIQVMNSISSATSIVFVPKGDSNNNYIEFRKSSSTDSEVGMQSGGQVINFSSSSIYDRPLNHEILHALGFFHEHSRADRDDYVTINWSNIKPGKIYNFLKYTSILTPGNGVDFGNFDYDSIMIYPSTTDNTDFAYDISEPIMTKKNGGSISYNTTLSSGDIAAISSIYGPPYHRLEHHLIRVVEDSVSGYSERYITEVADSIVFYADKSCLIRTPLVYDRVIGVNTTHCYNNGDGYTEELNTNNYTVLAGTTAYCLRHGYNYYLYYASDPEIGYDVKEYSLIHNLAPSVNYY